MKKLRFIDLFAGLGGFHLGLQKLGHRCVFACEVNAQLRELYEKNFGIEPFPDIRKIDPTKVPNHDIMCAGFPCQPFSKAGSQSGFECPNDGELFSHIMRIVREKKPKFIIMENVPNLLYHNEGCTADHIFNELKTEGYTVDYRQLSPHLFGIPQIRDRVFIVGSRKKAFSMRWPAQNKKARIHVSKILERKPRNAKPLSPEKQACLKTWQELLNIIPNSSKLPHPLWAMEFGATYPVSQGSPRKSGRSITKYRGSFGKTLKGLSVENALASIPSYSRNDRDLPDWKVKIIIANRKFYAENKRVIDPWLEEIQKYPQSYQKLEWNCLGERRTIKDKIVQFRASGIRVKRPDCFPTLVSMSIQQLPVIPWENRFITMRECLRIQSLQRLRFSPEPKSSGFKAIGNAVNSDLVARIAKSLIS